MSSNHRAGACAKLPSRGFTRDGVSVRSRRRLRGHIVAALEIDWRKARTEPDDE
jgi:hypothetical protein